jgi:hypothetical protein
MVLAMAGTHPLFAEAPTLEQLFPAGAARGSTNVVTAVGKAEPWPVATWIAGEGVSICCETNAGRLRIQVAADAMPGPRLVRLINDDGASAPRFFVVGDGVEIREAEPNNHYAEAQDGLEFPVTVNGRLDKNGDVDCFLVEIPAGQWLDARLDAYTLMSPVDAVLRLVATNGIQIAWNHDSASLDPRLIWRAPRHTRAVLQVFGFRHPADAAIRLSGGEAAVYRLHLARSTVRPNVLGESGVALDCTNPLSRRTGEGGPGQLEIPGTRLGIIAHGQEEDRHQFIARANEVIELRVDAIRLGSPLDAWLSIEDASGRELARSDDEDGSPDPRLEWKAPEDGPFVAVIGSVTHRGGDHHGYRLSLRRLYPWFAASLEASAITASRGGTNELKLRIKRLRGHTNSLVIRCDGLPAGVLAQPVAVPAGDGEVNIPLLVKDDAAPFMGPVRLILRDEITQEEQAVAVELTSRGVDNGVPQGFQRLVIERTDRLWLTVKP